MSRLMDLIARVRLHTKNFEAGLKKVESETEKTGRKISSEFKSRLAAAFSVAAVTTAARSVINFADNLDTLAQRADISVEELQRLNFAAASTGVELDLVVDAFKELSKARAEALADPKGTKARGFGLLGISIDELRDTRDLIQLLRSTSSGVRTQNLGANKLAVLQDLFSDTGPRLLPFLNANMDRILDRFEELGGAVSGEIVQSAAEFNRQLREMGVIAKTAALPALSEMANAMGDISSEAGSVLRGLASLSTTLMDVTPNLMTIHRNAPQRGRVPTGMSAIRVDIPMGSREDEPITATAGAPGAAGLLRHGLFISQLALQEHLKQLKQGAGQIDLPGGSLTPTDNLVGIGNFLGTAARGSNPQVSAVVTNTRMTAQNTGEMRRVLAERVLHGGTNPNSFFATIGALFPQ